MDNDLKAIIKKALIELEQIGVIDIVIKGSLVEFAKSYNTVSANEQRICYDTAAEEFLKEIFGKDSDGFTMYWMDYQAAKAGDISIESPFNIH